MLLLFFDFGKYQSVALKNSFLIWYKRGKGSHWRQQGFEWPGSDVTPRVDRGHSPAEDGTGYVVKSIITVLM